MDRRFALERNGPIIADEMRGYAAYHSVQGLYVVVSLAYERPKSRAFPATTLKQAFRILASVADSSRGKRYQRGEFAACIVTPDGSVMNWTETRDAIKAPRLFAS